MTTAPTFDPAHRLSQNFTLGEFTRSQTATRRGIRNAPRPEHIRNMEALCREVLEPIRAQFRRPVVISSGFRSAALNRAIGGSATSQHSNGEAADIEVPGVDNRVLARWIAENLTFDQLILEGYRVGVANSGWVHVSYSRSRARKQVLTATFPGPRYSAGLPD